MVLMTPPNGAAQMPTWCDTELADPFITWVPHGNFTNLNRIHKVKRVVHGWYLQSSPTVRRLRKSKHHGLLYIQGGGLTSVEGIDVDFKNGVTHKCVRGQRKLYLGYYGK
ncbi:unnamed protein product [Prunus armeniaca]